MNKTDLINLFKESTHQENNLFENIVDIIFDVYHKQIMEVFDMQVVMNKEEQAMFDRIVERNKFDEKWEDRGRKKDAINMIKKNYPISDISEITGLSIKEIEQLKLKS